MAHRRARLNVFGPKLLVTRIELEGWPVAKAAEAQGRQPNDGPQVAAPQSILSAVDNTRIIG